MPVWRHVVAVLLYLGGLLPLAALLFLNGAVALDTRHLEGVERRLWITTFALASLAWVLFALGRSVQRGFRFRTWLTSGLVMAGLAGLSAWTSVTLMLAHSGHIEAGLISDLQAFQVAQEAYRKAAGGRYADRIECLRAPRSCGVAADAALSRTVADRLLVADPRYHRFQLDAPTPDRYALLSAPVAPNRGGTRSFCADSAGRLCASDVPLPLQDGRCTPSPACHDR